MAYKLTDAKITHISLVDKGANGRPFAIIKEEGKESLQKDIRIAKTDKARQVVYGVVYEPDVEDAHEDTMTADEIEKAAHGFMERQNTYNIDKQHDLDVDKGYVVESYIAPVDIQLGDQEIKKGSWIAGVKVTDDDTWTQIEKGEITGFSMFGVSKREEIEDEEVPEGLLKKIAKALGLVEKGAVSDTYNRRRTKREYWAAQDALNSVLLRCDSWDGDEETDPKVIREALQDFVEIVQEVLTQDDIVKAIGRPPEHIKKAGKKISAGNMKHLDDAITALTELKNKTAPVEESEEEDEVKTEEIAKAVAAAVAPISKQVEALTAELSQLKKDEGIDGAAPAADGETAATPEQETLTETIAKALEPIKSQMQALSEDVQLIKNSRGGAQPDNEDPIQKADGDVTFAGIL